MSNIIDKIQLSGVTYDIGGQGGSGVSVVEVTQAEYDALPSSAKTDTSKMYVITDAEAGDLTNYYTKTETNTLLGGKADTATTYTKSEVDNAITAATATKQDTLVSGTNIKTINNESILGSGNIDIQGGGGGKAIEAGRGISITTGETADTVSFNLPIYDKNNYSISECHPTNSNVPINSGNYNHLEHPHGSIGPQSNSCHKEGLNTKIGTNSSSSHVEGFYSEIKDYSQYSHAEGYYTSASGQYTHTEGYYTKTTNEREHASGSYNVSNKANNTWGDSGNTLFSVGNGTADNARHNAFEIRQNGDIYCSDGTNDVKLQDTITATAANTTALGGLKLVKLTQSAYDALSPNYDSNTLYVIVN